MGSFDKSYLHHRRARKITKTVMNAQITDKILEDITEPSAQSSIEKLIILIEEALDECDERGWAFAAIDLCSALAKLEAMRGSGGEANTVMNAGIQLPFDDSGSVDADDHASEFDKARNSGDPGA